MGRIKNVYCRFRVRYRYWSNNYLDRISYQFAIYRLIWQTYI